MTALKVAHDVELLNMVAASYAVMAQHATAVWVSKDFRSEKLARNGVTINISLHLNFLAFQKQAGGTSLLGFNTQERTLLATLGQRHHANVLSHSAVYCSLLSYIMQRRSFSVSVFTD